MAEQPHHIAEQFAIIERMANPGYAEEEFRLFSSQMQLLTNLLRPAVSRALFEEVSGEHVNSKIEEIKKAARRALPYVREFFEKPRFRHLQEAFEARLSSDASIENDIQPSEDEINLHSGELAHCMLTNWHAILDTAVAQQSDEIIELGGNGLPLGSSERELLIGLNRFALSDQELLDLNFKFQQALRQKLHVDLAPDLFYGVGAGRVFAGTDREALAKFTRDLDLQDGRRRAARNDLLMLTTSYRDSIKPFLTKALDKDWQDMSQLDDEEENAALVALRFLSDPSLYSRYLGSRHRSPSDVLHASAMAIAIVATLEDTLLESQHPTFTSGDVFERVLDWFDPLFNRYGDQNREFRITPFYIEKITRASTAAVLYSIARDEQHEPHAFLPELRDFLWYREFIPPVYSTTILVASLVEMMIRDFALEEKLKEAVKLRNDPTNSGPRR